MKYLYMTLILCSKALCVAADPCTDYAEISDWHRSVSNGYGDRCDTLLVEGWYRSTSPAGELMPTSCVIFGGRCGTAYTLWLNGSYPSVWDTTNATVCASDIVSTNCCVRSYDIQIKNCDAFYVYYLKPVNGCPQAYCFGSELPCPEGETSINGFTPGCTGTSDPCTNYQEINDWRRSVAYGPGDRCDSLLIEGWYRITSPAGELIPTSCIPMGGKCDTAYSLWLNGSYPNVGDITNATVCASDIVSTNCCVRSYDIQIKNCDAFYVYYLKPVNGCPQAYCFGFELPCPEGETSINGFTPGCTGTSDPCTNYQEINDWRRSVAYGPGDRCDSLLIEGWYRITSPAGELIPTSCISMGGKCDTAYSLWLNGSYPNVGDTTNATVCASDIVSTNCCVRSYDIQIKNCDAFYVYYLKPVNGCPQAYCFGSELPCPEGETSINGFTPGCTGTSDPCTNNQEINDWRRSVAYGPGNRCDSLLIEGWYRITSPAGELMPTSCIPMGGKCDTAYSLWLNGSYPNVGDTTNATVCASDIVSTNCCVRSYDIQIKNCDGFYVYYLKPVIGCPQAYCFGSEKPCPEGQISSTGFTPGCQVVQSTPAPSSHPSHPSVTIGIVEENNKTGLIVGMGIPIIILLLIIITFIFRRRSKQESLVNCVKAEENPPAYHEAVKDCQIHVHSINNAPKDFRHVFQTAHNAQTKKDIIA